MYGELSPPNSLWDRLAARIRLLTDPGKTERRRTVVAHPTTMHPVEMVWIRVYVCEYVLHFDRHGVDRMTILGYDHIETTCVNQRDVGPEQSKISMLTVDNDGEWGVTLPTERLDSSEVDA